MTNSFGTTVVHPVVVTANLNVAMAYYCDVIGLIEATPVHHDADRLTRLNGLKNPVADAVVLRAPGGGEIELVQFYHPVGNSTIEHGWSNVGISSITFRVDRLETSLDRVRAAGYHTLGEIVRFPERDGQALDVVYISAPDGVVITLITTVLLSENPKAKEVE